MDLRNINQVIEELFYEFATWIALAPKTYLRAFFKPSWIQEWVSEEFTKDQASRFKNFLNPFIVWLFSILVILWSVSTTKTETTFQEFLVFLIIFIIFPEAFAVVMLRAQGTHLDGNVFRRPFYIQMMVFGVFQAVFGMALAVSSYLLDSGLLDTKTGGLLESLFLLAGPLFALGLVLLPFLWIPIAEIIVMNKELKRGFFRALGWAFAGLFILLVISIALPTLSTELETFAKLVDFNR